MFFFRRLLFPNLWQGKSSGRAKVARATKRVGPEPWGQSVGKELEGKEKHNVCLEASIASHARLLARSVSPVHPAQHCSITPNR